jgi:AcrR family transcriptional regulator
MGVLMTVEHSGSGDVSRSLALLWAMDGRPSRGPKPKLTVDRIVTTAIKIADAAGLEAVSMRRIAAALGVGAMSLYRYVPSKAELLDLMLDRVIEIDPDAPTGEDWRSFLAEMGRGMWELYTRHPWLPQVDQTRPVLGPRALAGLEHALQRLTGLALPDAQKIQAISAIETLAAAAARLHNNAVAAEQRSGMSAEEFWRAQEPVLTKALASGRFPKMATLADDAFAGGGAELFEFGLQRLLDGLAVLVEQQASSGDGARHSTART